MHNNESAPDLADLFLQASRTIRGRWRDSLIPAGVTPHQSRVLSILGRANETGMRNSQLAERLHIAARSTTEVVDQLEEKQLIVRTPDPGDRRATLITLSGKGRTLLGELSVLRKAGMDSYFDKLNVQDQRELARLLNTLNKENPMPPRAGCKPSGKAD